MKIAFPTADKTEIFTRTGQSPGFLVYTTESDKVIDTEYVLNRKPDDKHDETEEHHHKELIEALSGVDLLVVNALGKHLKKDLEDNNIRFYSSSQNNIIKAMEEYFVSKG